ncbi:hypothetical protein T11_15903 [Trichinella zimbabwensis]|uniref:Uncharacterized protein n=1 Tax=Trichinella zimbabwensis TaxID=268475 RepID=A0A0V1GQK5_9BILA|nr:hypothetical protein T11_15903 [Trichinella zimbabwensis]
MDKDWVNTKAKKQPESSFNLLSFVQNGNLPQNETTSAALVNVSRLTDWWL